tara:strand:- start:333 stop:476 length:144 start_codon:yes stop_codon:yes gene_type:complete
MLGFLALIFLAYYIGFEYYDNWFSNCCAGLFIVLLVLAHVDGFLKKL